VRPSASDCSECSKAAEVVDAAVAELADGRLDLAAARLRSLAWLLRHRLRSGDSRVDRDAGGPSSREEGEEP